MADNNQGNISNLLKVFAPNTMIPEVTQAGLAVAQGIASIVKKSKANAIDLSVDPLKLAILDKISARGRAYQTGTALDASRSALGRMIKTNMRYSTSNSGGQSAGLLNKIIAESSNALVAMQSESQKMETQLLGLEEKVAGDITQQRLEVNLLKRAQLMAEAAVNKQAATSAFGSAVARGVETDMAQ